MNNYISKYSKYDTHFNRTDKFKYAYFEKESKTSKALIGFCFIVSMILLAITYLLLAA